LPLREEQEMTVSRKNQNVSRRKVLKGAAALAVASAGSSVFIPGAYASPVSMDLQLGWLAGNGNMGETAGKLLGYFEEENIDLTITPGGPNVEGVQSVAAGTALVGQASASPFILFARSAGIPVRGIAAGFRPHPTAFFSLPDKPIRTPQDMIGKRIGSPRAAQYQVRALLAKHGIPEDQVEVISIGADYGLLPRGQVDAVLGWITNTNALKVLGEDYVTMLFWDVGIQVYAQVYYVSDAGLENDSERIAGFVRAASRGWAHVYEQPENAVDLLVKEYPSLNHAVELETVPLIRSLAYNEETSKDGWGTMDPENWGQQINDYATIGQFAGEIPKVEDVMTLDILNATADARPKLG
jgi:NitT/TauT family transport system substrate-binding protein